MPSRMMNCKSCCGSKGRSLHYSFDGKEWKCDNCGHVREVKDRRRKADTGHTVFDRVTAKLAAEEDNVLYPATWQGYCTFEELEEMSRHHALREWSTHCPFGIVPVPKSTLRYFFTDGYKKRSAERLAEKTGRPVEARVRIKMRGTLSGCTYDVTVSGIYAFTDDERSSYFPL